MLLTWTLYSIFISIGLVCVVSLRSVYSCPVLPRLLDELRHIAHIPFPLTFVVYVYHILAATSKGI